MDTDTEKLAETLALLQPEKDPDWSSKLQTLITGIEQKPLLEKLGASLSLPQAIALLDFFTSTGKSQHLKLLPILVGLPHELFALLIGHLSAHHLNLLRHEALAEPIQHQLTLLAADWDHREKEIVTHIEKTQEEIQNLNVPALTQSDLAAVHQRIDHLATICKQTLQLLSKVLTIAWSTNRLDLIDRLGALREAYQRLLARHTGSRRTAEEPPTGLFADLEKKLHAVFGDLESDVPDFQALQDSDPGIEALSKLGIWYLEDYWEVGLLPHIPNRESLPEDTERRNQQLLKVRENLRKIDLPNVQALKEQQVWSRALLQAYIQRHQEKISLT